MRFYVRGRGEFPFDMLRYDTCYPASPVDSAGLYGGWDAEGRTVQLITNGQTFTPDRWRSFGWTASESNSFLS